MTKPGREANQSDSLTAKSKFSPDFAGDEQARNMIANMAQLKDGKYVVTFDEMNKETGQIESVTKEVSELTKDNKEALLKMNEPAKSAIELQKEANNSLVNINNSIKALKGVVPRRLAANPGLDKSMKKAANILSPLVEGAGGAIGFKRDKSGRLNTDDTGKKIDAATKNVAEMFSDLVSGKRTIEQVGADLKNDLKGAFNLKDIEKGFNNAYDRKRNEIINSGEDPGPKLNDINKLKKAKDYLGDLITSNSIGGNTRQNAVSTSVTPSQRNRDKIINSGYDNQSYANNNRVNTNIGKKTSTDINLNIDIKVNPNDLEYTIRDFLNTEQFKKEIILTIDKKVNEKQSLIGNNKSKY